MWKTLKEPILLRKIVSAVKKEPTCCEKRMIFYAYRGEDEKDSEEFMFRCKECKQLLLVNPDDLMLKEVKK